MARSPGRRSVSAASDDSTPRRVLPSIALGYWGWLPKISGHQVHRLSRSRLTKRARIAFGTADIPPSLYPQTHAHVTITRVLGPRQKPMDDDSIALLTVGIRDALKPCYIVDDSPKWATFTYRNDDTRRHLGPRIDVDIRYAEE